jgi:hypothetical protein
MDLEKFIEMAQTSQSTVARHGHPSAMTPMIYVCLITVVPSFVCAYCFRDDPYVKYPLICLAFLVVVVTCAMYIYWAFASPDRLQSEDYQIRQETLQMISKKGGKIVIDPVSLGAIANPPVSLTEKRSEPSA